MGPQRLTEKQDLVSGSAVGELAFTKAIKKHEKTPNAKQVPFMVISRWPPSAHAFLSIKATRRGVKVLK
jgi:hypothetical protein